MPAKAGPVILEFYKVAARRQLMSRISLRVAATAAFLLTSAFVALAQAGGGTDSDFRYYHRPGMMWGGDQWGGFGMVLGPIFMILVLIGVIAGTVYLLKVFGVATMGSRETGGDGKALSILKERYARGEIDSKEFEERKRLLAD
jgi:putative membrane protein